MGRNQNLSAEDVYPENYMEKIDSSKDSELCDSYKWAKREDIEKSSVMFPNYKYAVGFVYKFGKYFGKNNYNVDELINRRSHVLSYINHDIRNHDFRIKYLSRHKDNFKSCLNELYYMPQFGQGYFSSLREFNSLV